MRHLGSGREHTRTTGGRASPTRLRRSLRTCLVALVLLGSIGAVAVPASAQERGDVGVQIVGGGDVGPAEHRSVAYLQFGVLFPTFCTGTLIHRDYVLTAAHCIDLNGTPTEIRIGMRVRSDPAGVESRRAAQVITHPSYTGAPKYDFDVALIKLDRPVTSIAVARVGAPGIYTDYTSRVPNETVTQVGWGYTTTNAYGLPKVLQKLDVTMRTHAEMQAEWGSQYVASRHIGAGGFESGTPRGTCNGDSGGPLLGDPADYIRRRASDPVHFAPMVIGVHSKSDCAHGMSSLTTRLDTGVVLAWLINAVGGEGADRLQCGPSIYGIRGWHWRVGAFSSVMCVEWRS